MKNDDDNNKKRNDASIWSAFAVPGQVFAYIVGGAFVGWLIGRFIDAHLNSTPVATYIGLLLGLAVGIYGIFRFVLTLK
jgi:F0F1-type ATP synthase assembly protein I